MNTRALVLVGMVLSLLLIPVVAGYCDNEQLVVVQDESSMEKVIEHYLVDNYKLTINEKFYNGHADDLYLDVPYDGSPEPNFHVTIDTQSLNKNKDTGVILERGVLMNLMTNVKVPDGRRAAVLEAINEHNKVKAFSSVYIANDGEIVCCWMLNVLSQGLPTEYVHDALTRVVNIWKALYPSVNTAING
jgi:hypothetical protein